jgi:Na+/citrate or Na+/malate symporter
VIINFLIIIQEKNMKKNLKNKIKKMVAGMMLACSLLTLFGGVSSDGIVPYGETVIDGVQWIA